MTAPIIKLQMMHALALTQAAKTKVRLFSINA